MTEYEFKLKIEVVYVCYTFSHFKISLIIQTNRNLCFRTETEITVSWLNI